MGGELKVSSQPHVGTQFQFDIILPIIEEKLVTQKTGQTIIGFNEKNIKLLIIDDNTSNREVVVNLLTSIGFNVEQAKNGKEGFEKALFWLPDVIITDLIMPIMNGFELIHEIRQTPTLKDKIIITSSASVYEEDKKKSLAMGGNAFLPKPIQVEMLFAELQKLLHITWIYSENADNVEKAEVQIVLPPLVTLKALYHLSLIGDIAELDMQLSSLATSNIELASFVDKAQYFLKGYKMKDLSKWLECAIINKS